MTDTSSLDGAVAAWVSAWCNHDVDALMTLWDEEDGESSYLPAEEETSMTGAAAVRGYITTLYENFETIKHRPETVIAKDLGDDIGLTFYVLDWAVANKRGPLGGRCRVTGVWRKKNGTWKLTQYSEAPLAPLVELRQFYQTVAAEGLPQ